MVPTTCYLVNRPLPVQAKGKVIYRALENPNFASEEIRQLRDKPARLEARLTVNLEQH